MTLSAEQLHQLAWNVPLRKLAAELGFSDTGLRKAMRARGIPTPNRRYWVRIHAGLPVEREALSPDAVSAPPLLLRCSISSRLSAWLRASSPELPDRKSLARSRPHSTDASEAPLKPTDCNDRTLRDGQDSSLSAASAEGVPESCFAGLDHHAMSAHQLGVFAVRFVESQLQSLSPPARCLAETWLAAARLELFQTDPLRALMDRFTGRA